METNEKKESWIGNDSTTSNPIRFKGVLDEFRLFDRTISYNWVQCYAD